MAHDESFKHRVERGLARATQDLLAARSPDGYWVGELSSSALSTATAVTALAIVRKFTGQDPSPAAVELDRGPIVRNTLKGGHQTGFGVLGVHPSGCSGLNSTAVYPGTESPRREDLVAAALARDPALEERIRAGLAWLATHQNSDGGWGDTPASFSNLSTTTLCWAAFGAVREQEATHAETVARAAAWMVQQAGGIDPERLASAIIRRYGRDRTFSVPILTLCALAGRLGEGSGAWLHVIPLPFELAACSPRLFAALRLPVVSYALPALIAMGQVRHHHLPSRNPILRAIRILARQRTLNVLSRIQPTNGGFLEATPLTSFVTMSLAASGQAGHAVTLRGLEFLKGAQRMDGSWPIDTNLATWLTTLAINALPGSLWGPSTPRPPSAVVHHRQPVQRNGNGSGKLADFNADWTEALRRWLLAQQHTRPHPYTHAAPGGWAWTDLPGGVPDADDTSGALLALHQLAPADSEAHIAATAGIRWLLQLQNSDGGIPTFCRGWGHLPFDRSSADITAHAVRAWLVWMHRLPVSLRHTVVRAIDRAAAFLIRAQEPDGSWVPLWFGNQSAPGERNPAYGTSRVLLALAALHRRFEDQGSNLDILHIFSSSSDSLYKKEMQIARALDAGRQWLIDAQNADGSWGGFAKGPGSIEETALVLEALSKTEVLASSGTQTPRFAPAISAGANWLLTELEKNTLPNPAPIGFYFAKLWYFEKLYPWIFSVASLRAVLELINLKPFP